VAWFVAVDVPGFPWPSMVYRSSFRKACAHLLSAFPLAFSRRKSTFSNFWAKLDDHTLAQFSPQNKERNSSCPFSRAESFLP
jgi:hypothetical protein